MLSRSMTVDVEDSLGKGLRGFLRHIAPYVIEEWQGRMC